MKIMRWVGLPLRLVVALILTLFGFLIAMLTPEFIYDVRDLWYWAWFGDLEQDVMEWDD